MIGRLFAIFDPSGSFLFNNWVSLFLIPVFLIYKRFRRGFPLLIIWVLKILNKEIKLILNIKFVLFFIWPSIFLFILSRRFLGLLPFVFASGRHMSVSLRLGLVSWGRLQIRNFELINSLFTHLVPIGTPNILMPFIVVIERVRLIIRPITLSVRLSANIIAGHLILSLICSPAFYRTITFLARVFITRILRILEISVALIQPYVFYTLLRLYSRELDL